MAPELFFGWRWLLLGSSFVPIAAAAGVEYFLGPECRRPVVDESPPKVMGLVVVAAAENDTKQ
jgi:hypothetical protein